LYYLDASHYTKHTGKIVLSCIDDGNIDACEELDAVHLVKENVANRLDAIKRIKNREVIKK
jgi:hypothetical protein